MLKALTLILSLIVLPQPTAWAADSYQWHDGDRTKTVYLNPDRIAQFGESSEAEEQIRREFPGAVRVKAPAHGPRVWKLAGIHRRLSKSRQAGGVNVSEVFSDRKSLTDASRALPGGVVVTTKPDWTESKTREWLAKQGFKDVTKINDTMYTVATAAGMTSLETANRLHDSGELAASVPNWWIKVGPR